VKYYSPAALQRLAALGGPVPLAESELVALLRVRLERTGKAALAREFGLSAFRLTGILRGRWPVPDAVAEKLGYRRISRFERIS
jgi:hypothetical protein